MSTPHARAARSSAPPRSYRVGIVRPGRCEWGGASVASGGTKGDVGTSLSARCNQVAGRESRRWDTVTCPNVVQRHHPPGSHAPGGPVRMGSLRSEHSCAFGIPRPDVRSPHPRLIRQDWPRVRAPDHEGPRMSMSRDHQQCIQLLSEMPVSTSTEEVTVW